MNHVVTFKKKDQIVGDENFFALTQYKRSSKHATMVASESWFVPPVHIAFPSAELVLFFLHIKTLEELNKKYSNIGCGFQLRKPLTCRDRKRKKDGERERERERETKRNPPLSPLSFSLFFKVGLIGLNPKCKEDLADKSKSVMTSGRRYIIYIKRWGN